MKAAGATILNSAPVICRTILLCAMLIAFLFFIPGCALKDTGEESNLEASKSLATAAITDTGKTDDDNAFKDSNDPEGLPNEDDAEDETNEETLKTGGPEETDTQTTQARSADEQGNDSGESTSGDNSAAGADGVSEGEEIKIIQAPPEINLHIIIGPEYAQDNQVCFYRVMADVIGEPFPQIRFNKDDSNGAWGPNVAQVNLLRDESFTLQCEAVNSMGAVTADIALAWVENPDSLPAEGQDPQLQPEIVVDYTDFANFLIDVNLSTQQVTVLYKDAIIKSMACSGGKAETPTPPGIFTTYQKIYYAWIPKFAQGAYYWTRFYGPYLFHSVPYDANGNMMTEELNKIGTPASHGCIRLLLEDAKWVYETLPLGMKVNVHN